MHKWGDKNKQERTVKTERSAVDDQISLRSYLQYPHHHHFRVVAFFASLIFLHFLLRLVRTNIQECRTFHGRHYGVLPRSNPQTRTIIL